MRTLTMNKADWSGEEVTVKIRKDGSFKVYDEEFKMKETKFSEGGSHFRVYRKGSQFPTIEGWELKYEKLTRLNSFMFSSLCGDIQREHKTDPYVAAIQVLYMIL